MKKKFWAILVVALAVAAGLYIGLDYAGGPRTEIGEPLESLDDMMPPLADIPEEGETSGLPAVEVDMQRAEEVLKLVNDERAKKGLQPLVLDETLCVGATIRAKEQKTLFSHTRPDGTSAFTVFDEIKATAPWKGENLLKGSRKLDAAKVVGAWMNSQGHKDNILHEQFTKIGVGYYQTDPNVERDPYGYWVQLFSN